MREIKMYHGPYHANSSLSIEGIKREIADAKAGRVVPHEATMVEIDAMMEAVEAERVRKVRTGNR